MTNAKQTSLFDSDQPKINLEPDSKFSDLIVYVDESGDHGIKNLDKDYPVFVLAFSVFYKNHYCEHIIPNIEKFKFKHFGHDLIILHEHEIRKEKGPFKFKNRDLKNVFLNELNSFFLNNNFILISCVIDKLKLKQTQQFENPYHLALAFCIETLYELVLEKGMENRITHLVFESRGKKEDQELELEFLRVVHSNNKFNKALPFQIKFAQKAVNSTGLQVADLVARPIGLNYLRPEQPNRSFNILKEKFYCKGGRNSVGKDYIDYGLKRFPNP